MKRTEENQTGFRGGAAAVPVCPYVVFPAVGRGEPGVWGLQRRDSGQRGKVGQHLGGNWVFGKGNETVRRTRREAGSASAEPKERLQTSTR